MREGERENERERLRSDIRFKNRQGNEKGFSQDRKRERNRESENMIIYRTNNSLGQLNSVTDFNFFTVSPIFMIRSGCSAFQAIALITSTPASFSIDIYFVLGISNETASFRDYVIYTKASTVILIRPYTRICFDKDPDGIMHQILSSINSYSEKKLGQLCNVIFTNNNNCYY